MVRNCFNQLPSMVPAVGSSSFCPGSLHYKFSWSLLHTTTADSTPPPPQPPLLNMCVAAAVFQVEKLNSCRKIVVGLDSPSGKVSTLPVGWWCLVGQLINQDQYIFLGGEHFFLYILSLQSPHYSVQNNKTNKKGVLTNYGQNKNVILD